jgi:hypothetical protein
MVLWFNRCASSLVVHEVQVAPTKHAEDSLPSVRNSESTLKPRPSTHNRRLRSRSALGIIGVNDSTVMRISLGDNLLWLIDAWRTAPTLHDSSEPMEAQVVQAVVSHSEHGNRKLTSMEFVPLGK